MAAGLVVPRPEDNGGGDTAGEEALKQLSSTDAPLYLSPSPELSALARTAARHLYASLHSVCPKAPPIQTLLAGPEFDAEQIWGQIDSLSSPLVSMLRREVKRLEDEPPALVPARPAVVAEEDADSGEPAEDDDDDDEDVDEEEEDDEAADEEEGEDDGQEEEETAGNPVEDRFLKMKELQNFLEKDEAEEYGLSEPTKRKRSQGEEEEDDDEEDEDLDDDGEEETEFGESARYEDFFGGKKKGGVKNDGGKKEKSASKKVKFADELEDLEGEELEMDDEENDNDDEDEDEDGDAQDKTLSTHEKELQKIHSKIEQMEKANLDPKSWTMQGEVTAAKRPKNSALEVDLDFQHNVRPPPVITEEVTASLEDLIRKRIIEGDFDDVQKAPTLPSKAPKELKDLDENKSKKGLAEIYEEEYAQKAGLAPVPLSSSVEQKNEAKILFKNLCLKLDALSHFHFAPKPVIEDMSFQASVPALAMEEVAPVAVSDASMLAPEEVFEGKGDIKEETELTQVERKRRRANKKRKYKAEEAKRASKKPHTIAASGHLNADDSKGAANAVSANPNGKESIRHNNLPGWKNA